MDANVNLDPPSDYYNEPISKYAFEVNDEQPLITDELCERAGCKEKATLKVQIRDERIPYLKGWWVKVCADHNETILDDEIDQAQDEYEPLEVDL